MKVHKLFTEYSYDFRALGLTTAVKEFKLAWLLNQALSIRLVKETDITIESLKSNNLVISNYSYSTEHSFVRLIKNKTVDYQNTTKSFLLPEIRHLDYLLLIEGTLNATEVFEKIKPIPIIAHLEVIEVQKLKSKENLIF
ncbi:MAG: IPExxxVDY family protein [Cytophagales bacterium]|nr:IPExxxVDY family protein [Cytophagales bacterium]